MRMFRFFFFPARDLRLMRTRNIAPLALKRRTTTTTTTIKMTNKQKGKEKNRLFRNLAHLCKMSFRSYAVH